MKTTFWIVAVFFCVGLLPSHSNAADFIVESDTLWAAGTGPYAYTNIIIRNNATLTVEPGVTVKFNGNGLLKVQAGNLVATGATFTWADGVNEWRGIQFVEGDTRSRLESCIIEHASGYDSLNAKAMVFIPASIYSYPVIKIAGCTIGNGSALRGINITDSSPLILNNTISGRGGYGIFVTGDSAPLVAGNLITGNVRGIGVFNGAAGTYRVNRIQSNTDYGFYNGNLSSFPNIDARDNWWGDTSGPASSGLGDRVSARVDFIPWAPNTTDSEPDGMWDWWEIGEFGDTITADVNSDVDLDGLIDKEEFLYGTDPNSRDSDGDGVFDGLEVQAGMNPSLAGDYQIDPDQDGFCNLREILSGTDPLNALSVPAILADGDPLPSGDGDVDGKDLNGLINEFNLENCDECIFDLDGDGDVDAADLFLFSEDFGRTGS